MGIHEQDAAHADGHGDDAERHGGEDRAEEANDESDHAEPPVPVAQSIPAPPLPIKSNGRLSAPRDLHHVVSVTGPDDILAAYEREAARWARERNRALWEEPALAASVAGRAPGLSVLDLGCGAGQPIAAWYIARGDLVTGVDGAAAMVAELAARVPEAEAIHADMRGLELGRRFDVILAFNSLFHLSPGDQRAMFPVFAAHAAPGARLLFTTGPAAGEAVGRVGDSPVYHASLDPEDYRGLLADAGFSVTWFRPEDAGLRGHSVWLAEAR
ncbi:methyltransferase domain-containing protein [Rhodobacterales bacterium HKCCSP123]|nr:methyltransferase domain-containing protein [Rhodobacterales bacterium HKCCSP123]